MLTLCEQILSFVYDVKRNTERINICNKFCVNGRSILSERASAGSSKVSIESKCDVCQSRMMNLNFHVCDLADFCSQLSYILTNVVY